MRSWLLILIVAFSATLAGAATPSSHASKKDRRTAEQEFKRSLELEKGGRVDEAFQAAAHAAELVSGNPEYVTAREVLRQRLARAHLERGNRLAETGDSVAAAAEFREALAIDPENTYVVERLRDVSTPEDPYQKRVVQLLASVDQIDLKPKTGTASFHVRGDARALYAQIGAAFDINMQFDPGLPSRFVRFDLENVDFFSVMALAGQMTKTFWAPVTDSEAMIAADTPDMRKQYERMSLRTFYIGNATSPTDLTDLANLLRNIFELSVVSVEPGHNTISVRGPRVTVDAAAQVIDNLMDARPELLLDVQEIELDTDKTTQYGLNLPNSFTVFNIPSEIRRVLGADAQPIIDQLTKTGTIDPSKIPPADLANLQNSPLLAPFVIVGHGMWLTGISTPPISGKLALNSSRAGTLEHATLRAVDGESATFKVGSRYPILTSTFSNVAFSAQGSAVVGNTPQFQYYDLGLTLKAKPHYQSSGDVRMDLELEIIGLGAASINSIPELTTRSFKANITVKEGEPSVVMGEIDQQETRAIQGYPGLGMVPVVQGIANSHSNERVHNEIVLIITPHVLRKPFHDLGSAVIWTVR
jgi:type II secretory pathway component GspD/PulD (secretin)